MANKNVPAQEFEDFVYMVAHDMSSAQRHVREFTKILLESISVPLNEEQKTYMSYVEKGLDKMEKMQLALLHYSRLMVASEHMTDFSSDDCLKSTLVHLGGKIKEIGATINIPHHAFRIHGNAHQIEEVFGILIDNALTYRKEGVAPVIDVTSRRSEGRVVFTVKDNGIGIKPEFFEQIYIMFRRLHPADSYGAGVGAGLPIARKIVRLHGGEITCTGREESGMSFSFDLSYAGE